MFEILFTISEHTAAKRGASLINNKVQVINRLDVFHRLKIWKEMEARFTGIILCDITFPSGKMAVRWMFSAVVPRLSTRGSPGSPRSEK